MKIYEHKTFFQIFKLIMNFSAKVAFYRNVGVFIAQGPKSLGLEKTQIKYAFYN